MSDGRVREILRARARALARRPERQEEGAKLEIVEFRLASERYGIEQTHLREVVPLKELTPLPCTPPALRGIINVRGQVVPVLDIKRFFDLAETGITDLHVVLIVHAAEMEVGILADAVTGVRSVRRDTMQASLPTLTGIRAAYLKGVSDDHVVILDAAAILSDPKLIVNDEALN